MTRHLTNEHIDKLRKQKRCKGVVQLTTTGRFIDCFYSISEASRKTGISRTAIMNALKKVSGPQISGGYVWRYVSDFIKL